LRKAFAIAKAFLLQSVAPYPKNILLCKIFLGALFSSSTLFDGVFLYPFKGIAKLPYDVLPLFIDINVDNEIT